jgi:hypothetical protein
MIAIFFELYFAETSFTLEGVANPLPLGPAAAAMACGLQKSERGYQ